MLGKMLSRIRDKFPILGGRLLKAFRADVILFIGDVSNPWREAIEV